jgi:hypothetical protein
VVWRHPAIRVRHGGGGPCRRPGGVVWRDPAVRCGLVRGRWRRLSSRRFSWRDPGCGAVAAAGVAVPDGDLARSRRGAVALAVAVLSWRLVAIR